MCATPKSPKLQEIPIRQPVLLPDNGDPTVMAALKDRRRLTSSAMIFSNSGGTLGSPSVSGPIGATGM
ncbi:MAG: hypothetical protein ACJ8FS_16585 [Sphingomicrobium sp.]